MTTAGTGRLRIAPVLMAIVLTVAAAVVLGEAAHLFLLLFLAILISLALGALADLVTRYTHAAAPVRAAHCGPDRARDSHRLHVADRARGDRADAVAARHAPGPARRVAARHRRGREPGDRAQGRLQAGAAPAGDLSAALVVLGGLFPKIVGVANVVIEVRGRRDSQHLSREPAGTLPRASDLALPAGASRSRARCDGGHFADASRVDSRSAHLDVPARRARGDRILDSARAVRAHVRTVHGPHRDRADLRHARSRRFSPPRSCSARAARGRRSR